MSLVVFSGFDAGQFGREPFEVLDQEIADHATIALFIDARDARAATLDVSGEWARWLESRKDRLLQINMLTGSSFIRLSADFVRRFAGLGDKMKVYTRVRAFESDLAAAVARRRRPGS